VDQIAEASGRLRHALPVFHVETGDLPGRLRHGVTEMMEHPANMKGFEVFASNQALSERA
jgi:hypothetical protein